MRFLAESASNGLPGPEHFSSIGWVIVILVSIIVGANQVVCFYKDHIRENPTPHTTYVTIAYHEKIMQDVTGRIEDAVEKIEQFSSANYEARKRMHKKINLFANAFHYLSGTLARDGRAHDSAHLKTLIDKAYEDDSEEG